MSELKFNVHDFTKEGDVDEYLNNLYLELGDVRQLNLENNLLKRHWYDSDKMPETITALCRDPMYLHFVCKYILNVDLLPYQGAMLNVLWNKLLCILIGSRGMAKSYMLAVYCVLRAVLHQGSRIVVVGAGLRQSLVVWNYIVKIWDNAPVLRDIVGAKNHPKKDLHMAYWEPGISRCVFLPLGTGDKIRGERACVGPNTLIETNKGLIRIKDSAKYMDDLEVRDGRGDYETPSHFVQTKPIDAYEIRTTLGYNFICSDIHQVWTSDGWKLAKDLTEEDYLVPINTYVFPTEYKTLGKYIIDENFGKMLGILVSEGCVSRKHEIAVKMADKECVDLFAHLLASIDPEFNVCRYTDAAYTDSRGWNCKETYEAKLCNLKFRNLLVEAGLDRVTALQKKIPDIILQSPKSVVIAFLQGLFWGDGSCFLFKSEARDNNLGISYYSGSRQLLEEVQVLLFKLGIFSGYGCRTNHISTNPQHVLRMYGSQSRLFYDLIGYGIPKWTNVYESAFKDPKSKADRKLLRVKKVMKLPGKHHLYDYTIPVSHSFVGGIFKQHNTHVVAEEFGSIPEDIFETVVRGFAAVRSDGVIGNVAQAYKESQMRKMGWSERKGEEIEQVQLSTMLPGNQIIMAGTAHYQFNHFYKYYQYYRAVILSGGDRNILKSMFPERDIRANLPSEHYGIIRIPADCLPMGLMDENILSQGRATMDPSIFRMEYMACFPSDSEGFYQAGTLNKCCVPLKLDGETFTFKPLLLGDQQKMYFMGIDPASESDRFAIHIQEFGPNNRGLCVYQWSTTRKEFEKLKSDGTFKEEITDYNTFCIKHIFALCRRFNIQIICLDSGGGGLSIREGLKDTSKLMSGELPILEFDASPLDKGRRILHTIQFADSTWRKDAHWGLRADLLQQQIFFPEYDAADIQVNELLDERNNIVFDTVGDIYDEIEQCKIETTYIKYEHTDNGSEKWGLPNGKLGGRSFQRDRFTSLLLANWARRIFITDIMGKKNPYHDSYGNVARAAKKGISYNVVKTDQGNGRKIFY